MFCCFGRPSGSASKAAAPESGGGLTPEVAPASLTAQANAQTNGVDSPNQAGLARQTQSSNVTQGLPPSLESILQPSLFGSGNLASAMNSLQAGDKRPGVLTVADFNHEIQDLAFIGQGASGDVYRGRWQGATVAVKYIVCQSTYAQQAATNEAALGRLLAHPNVVQTYSCKTAVLDEEFFTQLHQILTMPRGPAATEVDDFSTPADEEGADPGTQPDTSPSAPSAGSITHVTHLLAPGLMAGILQQATGSTASPSSPGTPHHANLLGVAALNQGLALPHPGYPLAALQTEYMSGEGFGNPLGQRQSVLALQEVLLRADAKLGYQLTQIVMEHCDKGSLLHAISRGVFLPTSRWGLRLALRALLRTAQEIAQGMWHIHQANVIHGDLKPGNVLLKGSRADRRGFVAKVSDFGLSRISEHTTRDSQHWGTVQYMAPETFDGVLARQSDVYSFGITIWQMITGSKPWEDLHPGQIIVGVQAGSLTLEWPAGAHPRLVKLGQSCVEYERKKRPGFDYIMKELSQIENMVRLEGIPGVPAQPAVVPFSEPASSHAGVSSSDAVPAQQVLPATPSHVLNRSSVNSSIAARVPSTTMPHQAPAVDSNVLTAAPQYATAGALLPPEEILIPTGTMVHSRDVEAIPAAPLQPDVVAAVTAGPVIPSSLSSGIPVAGLEQSVDAHRHPQAAGGTGASSAQQQVAQEAAELPVPQAYGSVQLEADQKPANVGGPAAEVLFAAQSTQADKVAEGGWGQWAGPAVSTSPSIPAPAAITTARMLLALRASEQRTPPRNGVRPQSAGLAGQHTSATSGGGAFLGSDSKHRRSHQVLAQHLADAATGQLRVFASAPHLECPPIPSTLQQLVVECSTALSPGRCHTASGGLVHSASQQSLTVPAPAAPGS